jgi:hypothetical protein
MGKREHSSTIGSDVNESSHYGNSTKVPQKFKSEPPCDPSNLLLNIYSKETKPVMLKKCLYCTVPCAITHNS